MNTAKAELPKSLTDSFAKKIGESHISAAGDKKNVFAYVMADVNESTSESDNIIVGGITDYSVSSYSINKKGYNFKIGKGASNEYSSRLGLKMFRLSEGEFTLVIEFFPSIMNSLSVNVVSESLNIGQQLTKLFPKYSRSIVHMHKYDLTPPE